MTKIKVRGGAVRMVTLASGRTFTTFRLYVAGLTAKVVSL